jgi:large subunit ribosomal protein L43
MSKNGVLQLQRILVRYCDLGGSSRGVRGFVQSELVDFARSVPHAQVVTEIRRNRHPILRADYLEGTPRTVGVKNHSPAEILNVAKGLRDTTGRRVVRLSEPVISKNPSIQGIWDPQVEYHTMETTIKHQSFGSSS